MTDEDIKEELLFLIRAGMAGAGSRKTSERVVANMARIVSGGTHSGRVPFGFTPIKRIERGKAVVEPWEIDETKAEVVREMARLAFDENLGFLGRPLCLAFVDQRRGDVGAGAGSAGGSRMGSHRTS